jgi:3-hydroxyisobutyrate dehydrogenase-like beta-hydroxyacid dehydrogenase
MMRAVTSAVTRSFAPRRGFATTARRLDSYGFVGLGQMGYQMAKNLQSKLKPSDKVSIFDVNPESMKGLETEMKAASQGATVELAASAFDASKDAVSFIHVSNHCEMFASTLALASMMSTIVLSMI